MRAKSYVLVSVSLREVPSCIYMLYMVHLDMHRHSNVLIPYVLAWSNKYCNFMHVICFGIFYKYTIYFCCIWVSLSLPARLVFSLLAKCIRSVPKCMIRLIVYCRETGAGWLRLYTIFITSYSTKLIKTLG